MSSKPCSEYQTGRVVPPEFAAETGAAVQVLLRIGFQQSIETHPGSDVE
jgi:hypothetical protein